MSTIGDCCLPCPTPAPVNIPGMAGTSAYTFTTASLTVPAIGSTVTVPVLDTSWMIVGQTVILPGPANFQISVVNTGTSVTLKFLGLNGDVAPGSTITTGALVVPTGQPGNPGYTLTTSNFIVPSVGNTVAVAVQNTAPFVVGENVITTGPANFAVTAIGSATGLTLKFLGYASDVSPGATINTGSTLASAGSAGANAYTTTTAQFTVPAIGSNVTVAVANSDWMVVDQNVITTGPANFTVSSKPSSTSAILTFLGYINDVSPGSTVANGSGVSPAGIQPVTSTNQTAYSTGTVYTMTATPALLAFSGISPSITLPNAGTWVIFASAVYSGTLLNVGGLTGYITSLLHRTNNSAADISDSTIVQNFFGGANTSQDTLMVIPLFIYTTATTGDIIELWGSQTNTAGTAFTTALQASIAAFQIA